MPRYFFHVYHDRPELDEEGEELPDAQAAWREATVTAGQIIQDLNGWLEEAEGRLFRAAQFRGCQPPVYRGCSIIGDRCLYQTVAFLAWRQTIGFCARERCELLQAILERKDRAAAVAFFLHGGSPVRRELPTPRRPHP